MSTEERYARATRSSHLEVKRHDLAPGDADTILAAGMVEPLGVLLARLRTEWDGTSKQDRLHAVTDPTARALLLINIRSLGPAKKALFSFALDRASSKGNASPKVKALQVELQAIAKRLEAEGDEECHLQAIEDHARKLRELSTAAASHNASLATLVGKVINAWLDKQCPACEGRGFTGGYGGPKVMCPTETRNRIGCGGSGSRRLARLSESEAEHQFGLWLMGAMDAKISASMGQMARKQRQE